MSRTKLTVREEFAIKAQIQADGTLSPQLVYRLAYPGSLEQVEALADLPANASRWWRSSKVQAYFAEQKAVFDARRESERKRIEQEVLGKMEAAKAGTTTDGGLVDYGDPRNQLRKLNELINTADDPGEVLDALKVVIARQGELAPEKRPEREQTRFYRPLTCEKCPLYDMADDVLKTRAAQRYDGLNENARKDVDNKLKIAGRLIVEKYVKKLMNK